MCEKRLTGVNVVAFWLIGSVVAVMLFGAWCARGDDVFHVSAAPDGNGGAEVRAGVDLAALTPAARARREVRRDEVRRRREGMDAKEIVADHIKHNWGKYVAAGGVFVVDRVAANNDWLWYDWFKLNGSGGSKRAGNDVIGDEASSAVVVQNTINGNGNSVNQTIIVQMPQGSGTGQQANTGTGGLANPVSN